MKPTERKELISMAIMGSKAIIYLRNKGIIGFYMGHDEEDGIHLDNSIFRKLFTHCKLTKRDRPDTIYKYEISVIRCGYKFYCLSDGKRK